MTFNFAFKLATAALSISLISSVSHASYKFSMNAMCYLKGGENQKVQPFNPTKEEIKESSSSFVKKVPTNVTDANLTEKFRVASLSKILVTHWAVAKLGPNYRFQSKVHVTPSAKGACNLYFQGDGDPFLGKEMLDTVFAQLKTIFKQKKVCTSIDKISYDDQFVVPFNDVAKTFVIQHRQDGDLRASNPVRFYGPNTTKRALQYFSQRQKHLKVNTKNIGLTSASEYADYMAKVPSTSYSFRSRPLHMMLREFNAYSFNVPPDILFKRLGGAKAYAEFIKSRLGYDESQVDVANGSGYPIVADGKQYNEVSCSALVRVIQDLDNILGSYKGGRTFQLADVMAVGGGEEEYSTFKSLYGASQYNNTLVAKTGSADEAITFGGMLSTTEGDLYFAVLTKPNSYTNDITNSARVYIRDLMGILTDRYKLKKFEYNQVGLMIPIDGDSKLVEISPNSQEVQTSEQSVAIAPEAKGEAKVTANTTAATPKKTTPLASKKAEVKKVEEKPVAAAEEKKEATVAEKKDEKKDNKKDNKPQRRFNIPFSEA